MGRRSRLFTRSNGLSINMLEPDNVLSVFGAVEFSPDGSYLFIGSSSTFQIYKISNWELMTFYVWEYGFVTDVIWTDDDKLILAAALSLVVVNVPNINIIENDIFSFGFGDISSLEEIVFYIVIAIILISTFMGIPGLRRYHPIGIGYYFLRIPIFAAMGLVYLFSFHIPKFLEYFKKRNSNQ